MRFNNTKFCSLNEKVRKYPDTLLEDYQTPERSKEMKGKLDNLANRIRNNVGNLSTTKKKYKSLQSKHRNELFAKKMYRKGDRIKSFKEDQDYIEMLESVLLALCEELELNPDTLLEDYQNFEREEETTKDLKNLKRTTARRLKTWAGLPNPHSQSSYDAGDRYVEAKKKLSDKVGQVEKERTHPLKRFGKGGKVVHGSLRSMFKKAKAAK